MNIRFEAQNMRLFYLTHGDYDFTLELDKNFYETFVELGIEVIPFNYITTIKKFGRKVMNEMILKSFKDTEPDIVFVVLHDKEIKKEVIKEVSNSSTITMNWFCDDHWRFESYTQYWAPLFHYSLTTSEGALKKYENINYDNVILTQWAANPKYYKPYDVKKDFEVTFVGAKYGIRPYIANKLKQNGINIECFGRGWAKHENIHLLKRINRFLLLRLSHTIRNKGRDVHISRDEFVKYIHAPTAKDKVLSSEEMIKMYSRSLINLNFSSTSANARLLQIKARNFEVPMAGGFFITDYIAELKKYFKFDDEIVVYKNIKDLVEKIKYYSKNQDELEEIRRNGYERSLRDHTYKKRFQDIFEKIGVKI